MPLGVVILMVPLVPLPTTAVILVAETTVNDFAAVPPKLTAVVPMKLVPVRVTILSVVAPVGVNDVIVGAGGVVYVKPAWMAVPPPGTVTLTLPLTPVPTTALILVDEIIVEEKAFVPPNCTEEAPVKLVPVRVITSPEVAVVGVNDVKVGAGAIVLLKTEMELVP